MWWHVARSPIDWKSQVARSCWKVQTRWPAIKRKVTAFGRNTQHLYGMLESSYCDTNPITYTAWFTSERKKFRKLVSGGLEGSWWRLCPSFRPPCSRIISYILFMDATHCVSKSTAFIRRPWGLKQKATSQSNTTRTDLKLLEILPFNARPPLSVMPSFL